MKYAPFLISATLVLSATISINTAQAQDGANLFATKGCLACHGADAKSPINDNIPILAGQNKGYVIQQITDIGSGARNNGQTLLMKAIASKLNEAEIEALATYLSGLPR